RLLIIDPGEHDGLGLGVVTKEQAEPPSDLRAPPMPIVWPEGIALAVFVPCRIARHRFQDQLAQRTKQLDVGVALEAFRIVALGACGRRMQLLKLLHDALVEQQHPSVTLHQSATSPSMFSSRSEAWPTLASMAWASSAGSAPTFLP